MIAEKYNRGCDSIEVEVNLGYGSEVRGAELRRYYFGTSGEWRTANPLWAPDTSDRVYNGLSGRTYRFTWDDTWPDNFWVVASNVGRGSSRGERKTVIRLLDNSGDTVREIEIAPY